MKNRNHYETYMADASLAQEYEHNQAVQALCEGNSFREMARQQIELELYLDECREAEAAVEAELRQQLAEEEHDMHWRMNDLQERRCHCDTMVFTAADDRELDYLEKYFASKRLYPNSVY